MSVELEQQVRLLTHRLEVAEQTARTSLSRANDRSGRAIRYKEARDALFAGVREALGMPAAKSVHAAPFIRRVGALKAERDDAVAAAAQLKRRISQLMAEVEELQAELAARPAELELELEALRVRVERQTALLIQERALATAADEARRVAQAKAAAASHDAQVCQRSAAFRVAGEEARGLRERLTAERAEAECKLAELERKLAAAEREAQAAQAATERQRERALREQAASEQLRGEVAELRAQASATQRQPKAAPAPIGLTEAEQLAAEERIGRAPRVVASLRGADIAALLRSEAPVAVALGRVSLGGAGATMDRATLVLALAQAWAKGVR